MAAMTEEFHRAIDRMRADAFRTAQLIVIEEAEGRPCEAELGCGCLGPTRDCPCKDFAPDEDNVLEFDDAPAEALCTCGHPEESHG